MGKTAALHNLGCKVNAYETEAMRQLLERAGYEIMPFEPGADVYVINTCTVTNIADRKSRQMIHRARKMNPDAIVVAVGCYVQTAGEQDPDIDILLGNNCKKDLLEALAQFEKARKSAAGDDRGASRPQDRDIQAPTAGGQECRIDIGRAAEYEPLSITRTQEHTRAYLKVQDGCNQFCSYCVIPYARGRVRSRGREDVLREVRTLAGNGCREVVLTGIHLSSYGVDLGTSLLGLVQAIHEVPGITRIRLGSLEPSIVTEPFVRELAALPKLCPHFHLSMQSGCDTVLKRMNRHYTSAEYAEKCALLREAFPRPALTTDVIVGFPGETEEEFEATRAFLEDLKLYETHIFKYSRRQGTRAAAMPDQIPESVKSIRSDGLIALGEQNKAFFEESWLGHSVRVLFEEPVELEGRWYYSGYSREYVRAVVPADQNYANRELDGVLERGPAPHMLALRGKE